MDEEAIDAVEAVLSDYLKQLDDDEIDTRDLAENVVRHLERVGKLREQ